MPITSQKAKLENMQQTRSEKSLPSQPASSNSSPLDQLMQYLKGVQGEWKKVTWPTYQQIVGQTIVVLSVVSVMTVGLFILDYGLHTLISLITPHYRG